MVWWKPIILGALIIGLCGCSMLAQERAQRVSVVTTPPGAVVVVEGQRHHEVTPTQVSLDPRRTHTVVLEKACHQVTTADVRPFMGARMHAGLLVPVSQLPETLHVAMRPTCGGGR